MDSNQLRAMRAILAGEANGTGFPQMSQPMLYVLLERKWVENVGHFGSYVYKSTQLGRSTVLAAGSKGGQ